jgi:hypothetical protein
MLSKNVIADHLRLPAELPAGFYWVKVECGGKVGVMPLVVGR